MMSMSIEEEQTKVSLRTLIVPHAEYVSSGPVALPPSTGILVRQPPLASLTWALFVTLTYPAARPWTCHCRIPPSVS